MQPSAPHFSLQPAFWMFPTELTYGKWAASGEVSGLGVCCPLERRVALHTRVPSRRIRQPAGAPPSDNPLTLLTFSAPVFVAD